MDSRWFFNFHRDFGGPDRNSADDDPDDGNDDFRRESGDMDAFENEFFGTFGRDHSFMFRQMDEMLSRMFPGHFDFDQQFGVMDKPVVSPRSTMLKDEDEPAQTQLPFNSHKIIDSDLDGEVEKDEGKRIIDLLDKSSGNSPGYGYSPQSNFSYKKCSSFRSVRLPDGSFEEQRTVTDSQGNKTTTVRRSLGDQVHEVTTKSDQQGLKEKEENFQNMDEHELSDFEKKWKGLRSVPRPVIPDAVQKQPAVLNVPEGDPSYLTLFKKFFGF